MRTDGALARGQHLLALSSFAVAQPLLDVFGLQADFFVARHSSTQEVVALAPLVFAAVFFTRHDVLTLVLRSADVDLGVTRVERPVPIVLVIFDELPMTSLLDENGGIDPIRYPSFTRLGRESWWLRRASTIDTGTLQAVPAMLTGVVPGECRRPAAAAAHPRNLLRVLEPHYAMNVVEPMTLLHGHEPEEGPAAPRGSLALDVAVIYLHVILPDPLAARLPPIDVGWGSFARDRMLLGRGMEGRSTIFRSFVASLEKRERPGFHFLHVQLPHLPWHYLPSGHAYSPFGWFTVKGRYLRDPSWAIDAWQRHLLQVGFVDLLLGELLERLEEIDLYDECLLVVTADHGISFWPGRHHRSLEEDNHPEDVLAVPLFVKLPNQRRGDVSWRNVEIIDIAPTIADVIGLELPWEMEGCSVLDESCPERPTKLAFQQQAGRPGFNQRLEFDPDVVLHPASLQRKLALFGSGSTPGEALPLRALPAAGGAPRRGPRSDRRGAGAGGARPDAAAVPDRGGGRAGAGAGERCDQAGAGATPAGARGGGGGRSHPDGGAGAEVWPEPPAGRDGPRGGAAGRARRAGALPRDGLRRQPLPRGAPNRTQRRGVALALVTPGHRPSRPGPGRMADSAAAEIEKPERGREVPVFDREW